MGRQKIAVRVKPRSSEDRIVSRDSETAVLEVRVKAAPVNNAANESVIRLISKAFKVPKSKIRISKGAKSRDKIVGIDSVSLDMSRIRND